MSNVVVLDSWVQGKNDFVAKDFEPYKINDQFESYISEGYNRGPRIYLGSSDLVKLKIDIDNLDTDGYIDRVVLRRVSACGRAYSHVHLTLDEGVIDPNLVEIHINGEGSRIKLKQELRDALVGFAKRFNKIESSILKHLVKEKRRYLQKLVQNAVKEIKEDVKDAQEKLDAVMVKHKILSEIKI